jgi:hypothetical protein
VFQDLNPEVFRSSNVIGEVAKKYESRFRENSDRRDKRKEALGNLTSASSTAST